MYYHTRGPVSYWYCIHTDPAPRLCFSKCHGRSEGVPRSPESLQIISFYQEKKKLRDKLFYVTIFQFNNVEGGGGIELFWIQHISWYVASVPYGFCPPLVCKYYWTKSDIMPAYTAYTSHSDYTTDYRFSWSALVSIVCIIVLSCILVLSSTFLSQLFVLLSNTTSSSILTFQMPNKRKMFRTFSSFNRVELFQIIT